MSSESLFPELYIAGKIPEILKKVIGYHQQYKYINQTHTKMAIKSEFVYVHHRYAAQYSGPKVAPYIPPP